MVLSTKVAAMVGDDGARIEIEEPEPKKRGRGRPKKEGYSFTWTPQQREKFTQLSEEWFENPATLAAYVTKSFLKQIPMLDELANNPPPGRSGPMVVLQAMKDIREIGIESIEMLAKRKENQEKKAKIADAKKG
jgi:hypothetical protein